MGRRGVVVLGVTLIGAVVDSIPTVGNDLFSFHRFSSETKLSLEYRCSTRNIINILPSNWFPQPILQRAAKKIFKVFFQLPVVIGLY